MISHQRVPNISFVALDENIHNNKQDAFQRLSACEKIDFVRQRILHVCRELKRKAPHDMWILAWKEYGIDEGLGKRAISRKEKEFFKKTMQELTLKYPNLTIVAGTVQTYKHVKDPDKVSQIESYYGLHTVVEQEEIVTHVPERQFFRKEKANAVRFKDCFPWGGVNVIRNSCFVFSGDKIWCHDKSAPVEETSTGWAQPLTNAVYQPAKAKNASLMCRLKHPVTGASVTLGIEICNEHAYSLLKKEDAHNETFLHLVLSHYISLYPRLFNGQYVIQLDTEKKPRLILSKNEEASALPIRLYQTNMFDKFDSLRGPLKPLYPFARKVIDKLDAAIRMLPDDYRRLTLSTIRENFYDDALLTFQGLSAPSMDYLYHLIEKNKACFRNDFRTCCSRLFVQGVDLQELYNELHAMIEEERQANPVFNDYQAQTDASPM